VVKNKVKKFMENENIETPPKIKKTMRELLAEKSKKKLPHFLSIRKKPEIFKNKVNKPR
jgi:hypothetical protein